MVGYLVNISTSIKHNEKLYLSTNIFIMYATWSLKRIMRNFINKLLKAKMTCVTITTEFLITRLWDQVANMLQNDSQLRIDKTNKKIFFKNLEIIFQYLFAFCIYSIIIKISSKLCRSWRCLFCFALFIYLMADQLMGVLVLKSDSLENTQLYS